MTRQTPTPIRSAFAWLALAVSLVFAASGHGALAAEPAPRRFDLKADVAENSLRQFATQSGREVVFASSTVGQVRTNAVRGELTPRIALERLLADTPLAATEDARTGVLMIRHEPDAKKNAPARPASAAPAVAQGPDPMVLARWDRNRNGLLDPEELAASEAAAARARQAVVERSDSSESETISLSPFEVRAEEDRGYYGANTMSGTRLNSKLEDLAAAITVVTKQQMDDTAAVDINDLFLYEASTEGTGTFTSVTPVSGQVQDAIQANPGSANRVRGLNAANITSDGFAGDDLSLIPFDTYNVDAVEISRGPNSNIFGLGTPGGTVNLVKSQAKLNRSTSSFSLRGDDRGSFRSSFDLNRPLGKKVAIRVLGLYDEKAFTRKPSIDLSRRAQALVTFRPFKNTTLRASYESVHSFQRIPNSITPRDSITDWRAAGSPTWDPLTYTARLNGQVLGPFPTDFSATGERLPRGLYDYGEIRPIMYIDRGRVELWMVSKLGNTANPNTTNLPSRVLETTSDAQQVGFGASPLFVWPGTTDKALYDWERVNFVSPNFTRKKADIYAASLEHMFLNTPAHVLGVQAAWYREDSDVALSNWISQGGFYSNLQIDVNERLLDGRPNPYFLRPYVRGANQTANRPLLSDHFRAQLAYQIDLSRQKNVLRWLGRHRISGYGEFRDRVRGSYEFRDIVLDDHVWVNPADRVNRNVAGAGSTFRFYVGDNQGANVDYGADYLPTLAGTHSLNWRNGVTGEWVSEPATFGRANVPASGRFPTQIRTQGLSTQSFLFGDRLVATLGWRKDRQRDQRIGPRIDPATGLYDPASYDREVPWDQEFRGTTTTRGVVARPFRGWSAINRHAEAGGLTGRFAAIARSLSVHYNESSSFTPAETAISVLGTVIPPPTGEGKDYGVTLSLLDGRLYLKVSRYETLSLNSRHATLRNLVGQIRDLDFGPGARSEVNSAESFARRVLTARFEAQGRALAGTEFDQEVAKFLGLPYEFYTVPREPMREVADLASKGWEIELNYNPTRHWTLKLNAAQQEALDSKIGESLTLYLAQRQPVWNALADDAGVRWFDTPQGRIATNRFTPRLANYRLQIATVGKPRPQTREWRVNAVTNYSFAGLATDRQWLRNLSIGGAVRWEDRGAIGFGAGAPDADGRVRTYDPNVVFYDPARAYYDGWLRYRFRFAKDKVRTSVQLNVRNLFEGGRLQAVSANPDGTPSVFRIVDPRHFMLTATFEL